MTGSNQHGFMKGKLCLTNLAAMYSEMTGLMDEGRVIDIFYLSFSKVFDTISYQILMGKLLKYWLDSELQGEWKLAELLG